MSFGNGVSTTNLSPAASIDELIGNITRDGLQQTTRIPMDALARQLASDSVMSAFSGVVGKKTVALLNAVTDVQNGTPGHVYDDPNADRNGIYTREGTGWIFQRSFPDSAAYLRVISDQAPNSVFARTRVGVSPARVEIFFITPLATNTGSVSLSINGSSAKPVININGDALLPGEWTEGRVKLLCDIGTAYQLLQDPDVEALSQQSVESAASAQLSASASRFSELAAQDARDIAAGYASDAVSQGNVPIFGTAVGIVSLSINEGINYFRTNGYYSAGRGGGAGYYLKHALEADMPGDIVDVNGQRWGLDANNWSILAFGARLLDGFDNTPFINAALEWSAATGFSILQPRGTMWTDSTIIFPSGARWLGGSAKSARIKKLASHSSRMLITKGFDDQKGNTSPDMPGLCEALDIDGIVFDGNWMTKDKTAYVNDNGGGGLFIYTSVECNAKFNVENMCGIGAYFDAPSGIPAGIPIGFERKSLIEVTSDTTKEEGIIFNGIADKAGHKFFQTNAGARIASEWANGAGPRVSPTFGDTNRGKTDGCIFTKGMEESFVHAFGNQSGAGARILNGRFSDCYFMAETNRYGGLYILGGYGACNKFQAHRSGGYDGDTEAMVEFDAPMQGNVNYANTTIYAYHLNTVTLTARPCVRIGANARGLEGKITTSGGNVPGHGVVIAGAADYLDLHVDCRGHLGVSSDDLPSAAVHMEASSTNRSRTIEGKIYNSAVGLRTVGTARHERIELDMKLAAGQKAWEGNAPSSVGQNWDIVADIDGAFRKSQTRFQSPAGAINSASASIQTLVVPHGLIGTPRLSRVGVSGIQDSPTSLTDGNLKYAQITAVDDTNITIQLRFDPPNAVDTQPRLNIYAEI